MTMPFNSGGHVGINMSGGSATAFADVSIQGGNIGLLYSSQQINVKGLSFYGCTTAIRMVGGHTAVVQKATFDTCGTCIDTSDSGQLGSVVILDCSATSSGDVLIFYDSSQDSGDRNNQIVIENLEHDGSNPIAVTTNGNVALSDISGIDTWVWGNPDPGAFQTGKTLTTPRSSLLLDGNERFFTMPQPTYADAGVEDIVNVKAFGNYTVKGDGSTDDSEALNAIIAQAAAASKIVYLPYGVYVLRSTLYIPSGIRMVGECWPAFSGVGDAFGNPDDPTPVVMVGKPGETGTAQIQDVCFTVADIVPGAIILQVNVRGQEPGDVALWNSHVTVGGFVDSNVNTACSDPNTSDCKGAFAMVHLTNTSSAYIENMWGWTADHSIDGGPPQNIATGRGLLVEATQGTWLTGTAFEHNTLYNYNLHSASNVYAGMQQTESAYWQGNGSMQNAPDPWTPDDRYGDPDFSWCSGDDQSCRMGLSQNVDGGSDLHLYGAALWTFFHGETSACYNCPATECGVNCIKNQARVTNDPVSMYWYGVNTRASDVMVLDDEGDPTQEYNPGGFWPGGVVAAYLEFAAGTQTPSRI